MHPNHRPLKSPESLSAAGVPRAVRSSIASLAPDRPIRLQRGASDGCRVPANTATLAPQESPPALWKAPVRHRALAAIRRPADLPDLSTRTEDIGFRDCPRLFYRCISIMAAAGIRIHPP